MPGTGAARTGRGHSWRCLILLGCLLAGARAAVAGPRIAVVDCAAAERWLHAAGVDCQPIVTADLAASLPPDIQLLILPLDRLHSDAALHAITGFAARGGKVIAVYWGTLARPDHQAEYPVYSAATALGIRVTGWMLVGPAVVQFGASAPSTSELRPAQGSANGREVSVAPQSAALASPGSPATADLRLDPMMLVRVDPEPTAQVLAWLAPTSGTMPMVLALRHGNIIYVAANLFHRGTDSPSVRRLFYWFLDQAIPGMTLSQARERAGAAMAAVIRAQERLVSAGAAAPPSAQGLLDQAREAAGRAKALVTSERLVESLSAAEQALELTARAIGLLEGRSSADGVKRP